MKRFFHDGQERGEYDRDAPAHATVEEAIRVALAARVKLLVLFHLSSRYPGREVERCVRETAAALAPELPIVLFRSARKLAISSQPGPRTV